MTAAAAYADQIDAVESQIARISAGRPLLRDLWGGATAGRFRVDPHRPLDPVLEHLASYLRPEDVLLDIGGGAGRMGLPLALHCREVVDVEPSPGMGEALVAAAAEAGITNVRWVQAAWADAEVTGDVALICQVTYFVRDIVAFIKKLLTAVRRRVLILVDDTTPADGWAPLFPILFGEPIALWPTYRELLPVLWEMEILPEVRILPTFFIRSPLPQTRGQAIDQMLIRLEPILGVALQDDAELRRIFGERFDGLFDETDRGFQPRFARGRASVLITWEPGARP